MRWGLTIVISFYLLSACTENIEMKLLEPYPVFHANSSKLWVINKVKKKGVNHSGTLIRDKDAIVFFKNEKFIIQPMRTLGNYPEKMGAFFVNQKKNQVVFAMPNENWSFEIVTLNDNFIHLKPLKESPFQFEMEFIPYPSNF